MWRTPVPSSAVFFAWSAALGKILTVDNLKKRHIIIVDKFYLCKRDGESVDHPLHYDVLMWLPLCGITFLLVLVCLGLFLVELSTYLPICIFWCD